MLSLSPSADTAVDGTGTLLVNVTARDQSTITSVNLIVPGVAGFVPVAPNDTAAVVGFPIPLAGLSGSQFSYYAQATDILNHETVTGAVIVTVR